MTSRANPKPNNKGTEPAPVPPSSNPYSPSVPISLYREVANELQITQGQLDSLKLQNQELNQQNQKLRIEIERTVQSALRLRQVAEARQLAPEAASESTLPGVELYFESAPLPVTPTPIVGEDEPGPTQPTRLQTEMRPPQRRNIRSEKSAELGGWWLVLAIILIVVTAFGTGFLIVRPLLPHR